MGSMTLRWALRISAAASIPFLLFPPLYHGWTHIETDFPNYYTAGLLARRGAPLRNFYDWTWFQRQMNYAGWGRQLGSYIPHPPLAMLPVLPLTVLPPMTAKRVWLCLNVLFLALSIWMLARMSHVPAAALALLALAGHGAMAGNFELGQYYVFLLLLMTLAFWLLLRSRDFPAGLVLGSIVLLKLYAGPFFLYFAWKRRWRAAAGMLLAGIVLAAVSVALFGWRDNWYFVTGVLPRAAAGEANDPFAPGLATPLSLIRHAFMMDPDVNPHPLIHAPAVVFFLQPLVTLGVLVFCTLALPRSQVSDVRRELAWFVVMLLLLATNRAFYVNVLLLIPVALLLEKATYRGRIALIAAYLSMTLSLPDSWAWLYPTTWVLLAVYFALGTDYWRKLRPLAAGLGAFVILAMAAFSAQRRLASYQKEPAQKFERVLVEKDAVYSASPAVSANGVIFESIAQNRYLLNLWSHGKIEAFPFDGEAFHPTVPPVGGPVYFELVAEGHSQILQIEPNTRAVRQVVSSLFEPSKPAISPDGTRLAFLSHDTILVSSEGVTRSIAVLGGVRDVAWFPDSRRLAYSAGQIYAVPSQQLTRGPGDHIQPAVSPDGSKLAYTVERGGTRQVWLQDLGTGRASQLTGGTCNSESPAWEPDSTAVVFSSDCQRGLGLPSLFRSKIRP